MNKICFLNDLFFYKRGPPFVVYRISFFLKSCVRKTYTFHAHYTHDWYKFPSRLLQFFIFGYRRPFVCTYLRHNSVDAENLRSASTADRHDGVMTASIPFFRFVAVMTVIYPVYTSFGGVSRFRTFHESIEKRVGGTCKLTVVESSVVV